MSEAWLTRTQSRGELDTASSVSLARSIYGSQAYFDAANTSSYQGFEVNLFQTTSQVNTASTTRHLNRPKSSPARTITERNQKLRRPSSAMPGNQNGQINKMRPVSAYPVHRRSTSALQRGRPASAVQQGYQLKRRPQSAAPWATSHEPLIEVEDYDELAGATSTTRIQSSNPVTLNNIPEYIKVWEGKPLLPRDYGLKHFDRKPWQRPKSDYGLRSGGWRRRRKTSKDGMASAISEADQEVEFERSCVNDDDNHKARLAWGQDDGWDGQSDNNKSLLDDTDGSRGLGHDSGNGRGGNDRQDGSRAGNYGDGSNTGNLRNNNDDSDLWASRLQPPKEDSDSDDDFFKKSEGGSGELTQLPSVTNLTNEKPESINRNDIDTIEVLATEPTVKLPPVTAVSRAPPPPATPWPVAKGDTGRSVLIQLQQQKPPDSQWMNYRTALARHSTRFELPMDMKRLETMSPAQYLCTHCIISDRRVQHYKRIFISAIKKSKPAADSLQGHEEVITAINNAHHDSLSEEEIYKVIDVVCLSPEKMVDFALFCGLCALTERMYRDKFISSRSSGAVQEYGRYKQIVEDADFEALDWKLRGCKISKSLRNLFSQL